MRCIHHDGRVGTKSRVHIANSTWVDFDDYPGEWVRVRCLRPLGPIEEELRSGGKPWRWRRETFALWDSCCDSAPLRFSLEDIDSEAIEACARIWEQHGVAL